MREWNHENVYVSACLQVFGTHLSGRNHEKHCPECQRIIRREPLEDEEIDDDDRHCDDDGL